MTDRDWWKTATIYQIYPRSYQDSDGDGVGDLAGIESRLDHLSDLGVDAIWISPIFPSPMADFGYDVSNYIGIHPTFGTMADFGRLAAAIKARGMKLLLDFVPGHSSDRHPWFVESRASKEGPKRDWYIWRDAKPDGSPPTNWIAHFGGPAWTWDEGSGQYYQHMFLPEQPNLNWRNPDLSAAMLDAMRFWYDRGVDGFRVDAFENTTPDPEAGDNPPNPDWREGMLETERLLHVATQHQPIVHEVARDMRRVAEAYDPPRLLVGEIYASNAHLMSYYGKDLDEFQLPYNFKLIGHHWHAGALAHTISTYEADLPKGGWPNWVLGNHDRSRFPSRFGPENARAALVMLLTLRGTPTLYQGDELAMEDVPVPPERVVDPWGHSEPEHGRDKVRTPMPWGGNRPFTTAEPWLPEGAPTGTVSEQMADPASPLALTKRLLALRRAEEALTLGDVAEVRAEGDVLRYARVRGEGRIEIAINCGAAPVRVAMAGTTLATSRMDEAPDDILRPHEGRVWRA